MSLEKGGREIHCDGECCLAIAPAPVTLRPRMAGSMPEAPTVDGWLFVVSNNTIRHYCPNCTARHLKDLENAGG